MTQGVNFAEYPSTANAKYARRLLGLSLRDQRPCARGVPLTPVTSPLISLPSGQPIYSTRYLVLTTGQGASIGTRYFEARGEVLYSHLPHPHQTPPC